MLRFLTALPLLLSAAASAFTELPDSSGRVLSLDSMSRRVDSLEASLVKLKMEKQDQSIYALGSALDWGKGFGWGFQFTEPGFAFEANYTFKALGFDKPYYLGNYRTIGIAAGFEHWINGNPFLKGAPDTSYSKVVVPYVALRLSSPVLMNFTSFSFATRLFWSKIDVTPVPGWGLSEEMQFWLTKKGHINVGFHLDSDPRLPETEKKEWVFRPYIGATVLFGNKGDVRMRPAT